MESFEVKIDEEKNRLLLKGNGMLKAEDIKSLVAEVKNANTVLKENAGILLDLHDFKIIKRDTSNNAMEKMMPKLIPKAKYVAIVMSKSTVANIQVKGIMDRVQADRDRVGFDSIEEALKWLDLKQNL